MANRASNHIAYLLATKVIDFVNDQFKICLMDTGFIFDPDTHAIYTNIVGSELPTNFGYTRKDKILGGVTVAEDDTNDQCLITWTNPSWTANGGNLGPSPGACIVDETAANDPVVGYIDFGTEYTQVDGGIATLANVSVSISTIP